MLKQLFVRIGFRSFCSETASVLSSYKVGDKLDEAGLLRELSSGSKDKVQLQNLFTNLSPVSKTWQPTQEPRIMEIVHEHCKQNYHEVDPLTQAHILTIQAVWDLPLAEEQRSHFLKWLRQESHSLPIPLYTQLLQPIGHLYSQLELSQEIMSALVGRGVELLPEANPDCMAYYIWLPSKCGLSLEELDAEAIPTWFDCSLAQIEHWNGFLLGMVLLALAREKIKPPSLWWKACTEHLLEINEFTEKSCSSMLHSLARLKLANLNVSEHLLHHITRHYSKCMCTMTDQSLANSVWAFGKMRFDPRVVMVDFWQHYWNVIEENLKTMPLVHFCQHLDAWQNLGRTPPRGVVQSIENYLLEIKLDVSMLHAISTMLIIINKLDGNFFVNLSCSAKEMIIRFLVCSMFERTHGASLTMCSKALADLSPWPKGSAESYWNTLDKQLGEYSSADDFGPHLQLWTRAGLQPPKDILQAIETHIMKMDLTENVTKFMMTLVLNGAHVLFSNTFLRFMLNSYVQHLPKWTAKGLLLGLNLFARTGLQPTTFSSTFPNDYWQNFEQTIDQLDDKDVSLSVEVWHHFMVQPPADQIAKLQKHILQIKSLSFLSDLLLHLPSLMSTELKEHFIQVWRIVLQKPKLDIFDACMVDAMTELGWQANDEFWGRFYSLDFILSRHNINQYQMSLLMKIALSAEVAPPDVWLCKLCQLLTANSAANLLMRTSRTLASDTGNTVRAREIAIRYLFPIWLSGLHKSLPGKKPVIINKAIYALTYRHLNIDRMTLSDKQWSSFWDLTEHHFNDLKQNNRKRLVNWITEQNLCPPEKLWRKLLC